MRLTPLPGQPRGGHASQALSTIIYTLVHKRTIYGYERLQLEHGQRWPR